MKLKALLLLTITPTYLCLNATSLLEDINRNVIFFNKKSAELVWESAVNPGNPEIPEIAAWHQDQLIKWREHDCEVLAILDEGNLMNSNQTRQACLLCRRPLYDLNETRIISELRNELQKTYAEAKICIPSSENIEVDNMQQVETAILNYLTKVKDHDVDSKIDDDFDAKIANENNETGFCLKGEKEFEKVMENSDKEVVLRWIWMVWREKVGPPMREPYRRLVDVENLAVKRHEYKDLGESWRDELETPYLRQLCYKLYNDIKPLYSVLHGVVRFYLRRLYGVVVPKKGPIPAHLLGNLWSKNWAPLFDKKLINLNQSIKKLNWTALGMARKADDFYRSLGLPAMTETFWRKSVIIVGKNDTRCPAAITVANMFKGGDYRLFYCSGTTIEDFHVFHHVMGHIQYYMAYENQTALFQNAIPALHESIGDAVMYGVMTPQHLHRLGLVNDSFLYVFDDNNDINAKNDKTNTENGNPDAERSNDNVKSNSDNNDEKKVKKRDEINKEGYITYIYSPEPLYNITETNSDSGREPKVPIRKLSNCNSLLNYSKVENDNTNNYNTEKDIFDDFTSDEILMFKQLLNKLPEIPFLLLMDEYRWKYFEGGMHVWEQNREFWRMATEIQGIAPPTDRGEDFFDAGAKFYVPYNTPSISYFLSSFLQHQLFESLCKAAVFGRRRTADKLPDSIPLHRCDIYGSKAAGKVLKDLMSRGHSQHWREILEQVTGDRDISAESLLKYYLPIHEKLWELVEKFDIPIGWGEETSHFA